jgi:hypothetical protein
MSMQSPPPAAVPPLQKPMKPSQRGGAGLVLNYFHNHVMNINNSKLFAGFMIIVLNIASRFVTIKLSKTMESYLKYTFSRDILVFAISWMGTRDIYVALGITLVFTIMVDYILNEESAFCCLPSNFTDYHVSLINDDTTITPDQIKSAEETIEKAKKQKQQKQYSDFATYSH